MKKSLWMLGLAVAAMTSCTNDEVVEVNQNNLIKFESFVNKGTRAVTETTTAGLSQFYVFGYYGANSNVLNNILVTKAGGYKTTVPWTSGQTYQFAAYATKNESAKLDDASFTNGVLKFSSFSVSDDNDLVIATVAGYTNVTTVPLTFRHKLSKVKFTLKNASDDGLFMTVSDIKFSLKQTGDYDSSSANEWTVSTDAQSVELTFAGTADNTYLPAEDDNNTDADETTFTTEEHLVLPQQLGNIKATFTASFYDANYSLVQTVEYKDVVLKGEPIDDNTTNTYWKPNYVYNYTASLPVTPTYIDFSVSSVEGWTDSTADSGSANVSGSTGSITF